MYRWEIIIMKVINYTSARQSLAPTFDAVIDDAEPVTVTRAGHDPVVIMALADYEALSETAYLMRSPANARRLARSVESLERGRGTPRDLADE